MIGAVSFYVISSMVIRHINEGSPVLLSTTILMTSNLYMLPMAFWLIDPFPVIEHDSALLALVYLGVVPTASAYILRVQLIQQVGSGFVALVSYLIPLFGLLFSWVFLNQVPNASIWIALVLILSGIAVTRIRMR